MPGETHQVLLRGNRDDHIITIPRKIWGGGGVPSIPGKYLWLPTLAKEMQPTNDVASI